MNNILALFKKETSSYFNSPIAYFNIIAYLAVSAGLFSGLVSFSKDDRFK